MRKPVFGFSDQVWHKPVCRITEEGLKLKLLDIGIGETVLSVELISCAVTAQLICAFVFAYAKVRFSHDVTPSTMTYNFRILVKASQRQWSSLHCFSLVINHHAYENENRVPHSVLLWNTHLIIMFSKTRAHVLRQINPLLISG